MSKILHKIAHWFGWNKGDVHTFYDDKERLFVGFRCSGCGKLEGVMHIDKLVDEFLKIKQ